MKAAEFINALAKSANVEPEQLQAIETSLADVEISDDVANAITGSLMTREAALNDPTIKKHFHDSLQSNITSGFENILKSNIEDLDDDARQYIYAEEAKSTQQRLQRAFEKIKSIKKDTSKKPEDRAEEIEALNEQIRKLKEEHNQAVMEMKTQFKREKITNAVRDKINSFNLVDEDKIVGGKKYLTDATLNKLQGAFTLELNDEGEVELRQKEDPEQFVYTDNEKQTLEKALKKELSPFIKRSEDGGSGGPGGGKPPRKPRTLSMEEAQKASNLELIRKGTRTAL